MKDKLHQFFEENDFDIFEPHVGHTNRFQKKLELHNKKQKPTLFLMSIAASIILILGFFIGNYQQTANYHLADVSPKMAEAENFFITTINYELKNVEKYRNIKTERVIEDSLDKIEELEDNYKTLVVELSKNENKRQVIQKMIFNYQQRLNVLNNLLLKLEQQKEFTKPVPLNYETI